MDPSRFAVVEVKGKRKCFQAGTQAVVVLQEVRLREQEVVVHIPHGYTQFVMSRRYGLWRPKHKVSIHEDLFPTLFVPNEVYRVVTELSDRGYEQAIVDPVALQPTPMRIVLRTQGPETILLLDWVDRENSVAVIIVPELDARFVVSPNEENLAAVVKRYKFSDGQEEKVGLSHHQHWGVVRFAEDAISSESSSDLPLLVTRHWLFGRVPSKQGVR